MWRAFFYAVGIGLFGLGLEGLVFDHVVVHKNSRIQKVIRRVFSDGPVNGNGFALQQQPNFGNNPNGQNLGQNFPFANRTTAPTQSRNLFGGVETGSRYGPSRFAGPAFGTGYGGGRVNPNLQNGTGFGNFQGRGNGSAQLAGYSVNNGQGPGIAQNPGGLLERFVIKQWMPWSLLASGAIIFLYTHTLEKRRLDG